MTIIGKSFHSGELERHFGIGVNKDLRFIADQAFEELKNDGMIKPTYNDISDPESWFEITEKGVNALERKILDDLDDVLMNIDPHLVEIRDGAWSAVTSNTPDALRQAAHSGRELIEQTLRIAAPNEEIENQDWYTPDSSSRNGITRRHRLKLIMIKYRQQESKTDLKIAEKACELILEIDRKLQSMSHDSTSPNRMDVEDSLRTAETTLRRVFIRNV